MATNTRTLTSYRALCFDVYGTIIDWEAGIVSNLAPSLPANHSFTRSDLLSLHHKHEAAYQASHPALPYSDLLTAIHPLILADLGVAASTDDDEDKNTTPTQAATRYGDLRTWPAFGDSVAALQALAGHYKLVVLSNVDRASFTARTLAGPLAGVHFDLVITAQDVGSYKPSLRNFEYMLREVREKFGLGKEEVLVTAQSMWHDHQPARELGGGLGRCWIDREGAVMGNVDESERDGLWQWRFATLGEMVKAVEAEKQGDRE